MSSSGQGVLVVDIEYNDDDPDLFIRTTYYKKFKYTFKHQYIGNSGEIIKDDLAADSDTDVSDEEDSSAKKSTKRKSKKEETYDFVDE